MAVNSADIARWHADVAAQRAKTGAQYSPDLLGAFLADVVTDAIEGSPGEMDWPHTTAALQAEEDGDCEPIDLSDDLDAPYEFDHYAELRDEARHDDA